MEPERVRAYLQAACAGLGFDVGEVWWTDSVDGSSTVAAIGTIGASRLEIFQPQATTSDFFDEEEAEVWDFLRRFSTGAT